MRILGLNTQFDDLVCSGFEEEEFSSAISLLDYDAVVVDVGFIIGNSYGKDTETYQNKCLLSNYASSQIVEDYAAIKEQIIELLKHGRNIFLLMGQNDNCCIYTGQKKYNGTGKNAQQINYVREFDTYSFLPVSIKVTHVYGENIDICCNPPYRDFLKQTSKSSQYASYFSAKESFSVLATIKGTEKVVSAVIPYEKGKIVCLPHPYYEDDYTKSEYWKEYGKKYIESLLDLITRLHCSEEKYLFPEWAEKIHILNEKKELAKKNRIEERIQALNKQLEAQMRLIDEIQKYKILLTSNGGLLEDITKIVLVELGFTILQTEKGRSDIIAKYGDMGIVAEIKGVSKSAAEKHAAQLEKWASQYIEDNGSIPKALLIVNGFCDTPLADRTEEVFPNQMLKYSESRGHILITTTQLLCLYIETQQNPECKDSRIKELLSSVGKYNRYQNINDYLDSE